MITCSIIGCACQGTSGALNHRPMKAHECGFNYYAASYWYANCEPSGVYVSLVPGKAEEAAAAAAAYEAKEAPSYCDDEECEGCSFCDPDIRTGGEFTYQVKDLFSPAELKENRRALLAGEVVYLSR